MTESKPSGDFGYDLVHEGPPRPGRPSAPVAPGRGPRSASRPDDVSGEDLGYDDAHDF